MGIKYLISKFWAATNQGQHSIADDYRKVLESKTSEHIVIDGSLPAPDVVPDNVVPFNGVRH